MIRKRTAALALEEQGSEDEDEAPRPSWKRAKNQAAPETSSESDNNVDDDNNVESSVGSNNEDSDDPKEINPSSRREYHNLNLGEH